MDARPGSHWKSVCLALLAFSGAAWGQPPCKETATCKNMKIGEPLWEIPVIEAKGGVLSTTLRVEMKSVCVPTGTVGNEVKTTPTCLRTYVYQDPKSGEWTYGLLNPDKTIRMVGPGPTLRLGKAWQEGGKGDALEILLQNHLPVETDEKACASACKAGVDCKNENLPKLLQDCAAGTSTKCCCVIDLTQKSPNCFHGQNITNLHFHGTHASPQPPQDYVLLDLKPKGSPPHQGHEASSHGIYGETVIGEYQYRVKPFGWKQPEGTHWYHPHKHGSVGVQVANGLAGALLIKGPFDDWLEKFYADKGVKLTEKLMVIQQVAQVTPLFQQGGKGQIMVNGQVSPKITVQGGEVQRWRIVNATMSSSTLLEITLDQQLEFRQIALDGVRFSPINYECQPLINYTPAEPPSSFPCNKGPFDAKPKLTVAPGNRVDLLVRIPTRETMRDNPPLRIERKLVELPGDTGDEGDLRRALIARDEELAPGSGEPALFTIVIDDGIAGNEAAPKALTEASKLPDRLPAMPKYLENLPAPDTQTPMAFQQFVAGDVYKDKPWPYRRSPLTAFKIDRRQFDSTCANRQGKLGETAEWTISNETLLTHPFHIHTNPFQLFGVNGASLKPGQKPEPVWMDTIALAPAKVTPTSAPKNLSDPITIDPGKVVIRQRYEDFTGLFVLHCHFLGHEDRGMMFAVQTVCPEKPGFYGKAGVPTPECKGELLNALPLCK